MLSTQPKISVVIPAADEEQFLGRCIASVRAQKYKAHEVIVSVNGKKDATLFIANKEADKVIAYTQSIGAAMARNEGARVAVGDILVFIDADCQISGNMFDEVVKALSKGSAFGTAIAEPDTYHPFALIYVAVKNFIHLTRYHRGAFGVLFCNRKVFEVLGGFKRELRVGELGEFTKRARNLGIPYKVITYARTRVSMRRLSARGYLRTLIFWIRWRTVLDPEKKRKIAGDY